MSKRKILTVILLLAAMLALQFGSAFAAPATQDTTPLAGTIDTITIETDPTTLETTVVVTITDANGVTQDVRLSTTDAETLGLVTLDPATNQYVVVDGKTGTEITIDPALIIPDDGTDDGDTTAQHPVGTKLSDFFSDVLGVDYDTVMAAHDDGMGFGVIAQALWMTNKLGGDSTVFQAIIDAKKSGDYSMITLPDGSTPTNWGQFRKALLGGDKKANLGQVMSGHADPLGGDMTTQGNGHGNGNNGKNQDKGNNGKGNGKPK